MFVKNQYNELHTYEDFVFTICGQFKRNEIAPGGHTEKMLICPRNSCVELSC